MVEPFSPFLGFGLNRLKSDNKPAEERQLGGRRAAAARGDSDEWWALALPLASSLTA
jgi:hypothetical protein